MTSPRPLASVRRTMSPVPAGARALLTWLTASSTAVAVIAAPTGAIAQTDASAPGQTQVIEKIERGAFARAEAGPAFLVAPDAEADYGLGFAASVHLGYDLLPVVSLAVGVSALGSGGSIDAADGARDRLYFTPNLRLQVALLTSERDFLWVRGEGGVGLLQTPGRPQDEGSGGTEVGPSFGAAVGYEHFAVLRHFSFGVEAGVTAWLEPDLALGIFLLPSLKYSF